LYDDVEVFRRGEGCLEEGNDGGEKGFFADYRAIGLVGTAFVVYLVV
jgi:hypothetical protein